MPVDAPTSILVLSDSERREQGRPSLPRGSTSYRIALDDDQMVAVPVPIGWKASQLGAVGAGRRFVDETGTVSIEIETERWDGNATAWLNAADAADRAALPGYRKVYAYREGDIPPSFASDSAVRSFVYTADSVALQVKDLAIVGNSRPGRVLRIRLVTRAEDFALMQAVWDDVYIGLRVPS